jgi:lipooligosaccharide transport system permease protein
VRRSERSEAKPSRGAVEAPDLRRDGAVAVRRLEPAAIAGVMSREVANFRTFWKATTFSSVLEPVVYLLAFGLGLGATIVSRVDGIDYVEFVGTGMVATAVIFSSALPAMFGTFVKHRFQRTYDAILAAPVDVEELVTAEMLWIGIRAGIYGCFPLLVSFAFGLDPTAGMLLVPLFCFITALGFASFGIAVAGTVAKIDQFNYVTTLVITPLFLVAGTFFPIDQLPEGFQVAAQFNPLYQLVELVRHAAFGFETTDLIRVAVLLGFSFAMWRLAVRQMSARLID